MCGCGTEEYLEKFRVSELACRLPITPPHPETWRSTPPRGIEKLRGQVDRTGGDSQGAGCGLPENIE